MKVPSCAVVICTRDRPAELERCLASIERCSYPSFEVLVVDSAPTQYSAQDIARKFGAHYVKEPRQGLSIARNRGALECKSELVAYLDDDATAAPDWLSHLACDFSNPEVAVVTGRILALDVANTTQEVCVALGMLDLGPRRIVVDRTTPLWVERANFGGVGIGTNMALRRSIFRTWSGFDSRLGRGTRMHGNDENYAFFQLVSKGYRAVYTPEAVVFHPLPETMDELRTEFLKDFAAQAAYLAMLFFEESGYRVPFLKYAVERLRGARRNWRFHGGAADYRKVARVSSLRVAMVAPRGLSQYLLTRALSSRRSAQPLITEEAAV